MGRLAHDGGDGEDDEEEEGGGRVLMDVAPVPPSVPIRPSSRRRTWRNRGCSGEELRRMPYSRFNALYNVPTGNGDIWISDYHFRILHQIDEVASPSSTSSWSSSSL